MNAATEASSLSSGPAGERGSPWSPLRHPTFLVLWVATVSSNIGTWMRGAAAGWLMTALNPDPVAVSLVQAATTLPMFLFSLPARALADIVDRRRLLIATQVLVTRLAGERRRAGAYDWDIYEDTARESVFLDTVHVSSWLEHIRQHERVTNADRVLQDAVHRFHIEGEPAVRHLISARRGQQR